MSTLAKAALGLPPALFGATLIALAPALEHTLWIHGVGALCFLPALAFSAPRLRRIGGAGLGLALFLTAVAATAGAAGETPLPVAVAFLLVFGLPGAAGAWAILGPSCRSLARRCGTALDQAAFAPTWKIPKVWPAGSMK